MHDVHWFVDGVGMGHVCARLCACWLAVHGVLHGVRPALRQGILFTGPT